MKHLRTIKFILFLFCFGSLNAQPPQNLPLLHEQTDEIITRNISPLVTVLDLDPLLLQTLRQEAPDHFAMEIPSKSYKNFQLELTKAEVFSDRFKVTLSSGKEYHGDLGVHYKGRIYGDPHSIVALSIYGDHIAGLISNHSGNYVLAKVKNENKYIFYHDKDFRPEHIRECGVVDGRFLEMMSTDQTLEQRGAKTVLVYVEADNDLVQTLGSVSAVTSYITAILTQGSILFTNDGITVKINELKVWDTASPYVPGSDDYKADDYLETFRNAHTGGFNGNIGVLMTSQQIGGGLAADIGSLCKADKTLSMCVLDLVGDLKNVPEYSWDASTWVHEVGHLLGSRHTHACVWNNNNTQIDDCASKYYYENGSKIEDLEGADCFDPNNQIIPANGGFIMSYCHLVDIGVNLSLGFGQQSATVMRNAIAAAPCIGGSGGGDLSASPNPLVFTDKGGCLNLEISSAKPWQIGYDPQYPPFFLTKLPVGSGSGNATVELCAAKNTLPVEFSFPLYITDGTNTIQVIVGQQAIQDPTALFYPGDKTIAKAEGDFVNISILTNTDWKLIQNPYDTWVTIKSSKSGTTNSEFNLEILKNSTGLNRFAKIGLVYNNALDTTYFTVSQPAIGSGYINVPSEFSAGAYEDTYTFNVYSDLEWEITDISGGWMDPSPKKGKGNGSVSVKIAQNSDPNDRAGTMTFTAKLPDGVITKTVKINQIKLRFDDDVSQYKVFPNPASDYLNVELNSRVETPLKITLISVDGNLVRNLESGRSLIGNYSSRFDLSDLKAGFYTLIIRYNNKVKREKIVVIH
ncbi:MAG: T9SS type A sorting domain-containing protein [Saprospiraceae bacterium]|nr:T9SS type A sorting domain-containing protein [Saprospiraceae bacterium]